MIAHKAEFLFAFPAASIEGHTTHGGKRYYLVRKHRSDGMPFAEGATKDAAWRKANIKRKDAL